MPSEHYRYYRLDGDSHLHFAEWFSAACDEQAIEEIQVKHPNAKCEIWQGKRLVAKLSPSEMALSNRAQPIQFPTRSERQ